MNMQEVDKQKIESWLKKLNSTPTEVTDNNLWHLEFDYPSNSPERMHVIGLKPYQIAILNGINISPKHSKAFEELPAKEKREFSFSLRHELSRPEVDFNIEGARSLLECPTLIKLSCVRFADGLTLDSFYKSVSATYKTKLSAIFFINKNLPEIDSAGNKFDFETIPN